MREINESLDCNSREVKFGECQCLAKKKIKTFISDTGRLLIVNVKLCNVLRNKVIAVGVLVFEDGNLKGFKARKIYTGDKFYNDNKVHPRCNDISGGRFLFVIPEDNICSEKKIDVKVISHYTDFNRLC